MYTPFPLQYLYYTVVQYCTFNSGGLRSTPTDCTVKWLSYFRTGASGKQDAAMMLISPPATFNLPARLKLNRHWNDVRAIYTLRVISVTIDHQKTYDHIMPRRRVRRYGTDHGLLEHRCRSSVVCIPDTVCLLILYIWLCFCNWACVRACMALSVLIVRHGHSGKRRTEYKRMTWPGLGPNVYSLDHFFPHTNCKRY